MVNPYYPDNFIPPLIALVSEYLGSEQLSDYANAELSRSDIIVPAGVRKTSSYKTADLEEKTEDHKKLLTEVANFINSSQVFFWTNQFILLKWGTKSNSTVAAILTSPSFMSKFSNEFSETKQLSQIFAEIVKPVVKQTRQPDTCMIVDPRVRWTRLPPA